MADTQTSKPLFVPPRLGRLQLRLGQATGWKAFSYTVLVLGALISMGPFVWMVLVSFMDLGEALARACIPPRGTQATTWRPGPARASRTTWSTA
jgi:ABC-type glycerol-3-phosphate transport system permease component